jgi:hypothetical protein
VARTLIDTCDPCEKLLEIEGMPADRSITIAINDGPAKRIEVCTQHLHMLKPILDMYDQCGLDESFKPKRRGTNKKQEDPEPAASLDTEEPPQPRQLEMASAPEPEQDPSKHKKDVWVVCPLSHPTENNGPKRVRYSIRNTHADKVHGGLRLWDIAWDDPDGVLKVKCEVHKECLKTGLGFTTGHGLTQHIKASSLERVAEDELENIA